MNRLTSMQMTSSPIMTFSYAYGKTGNRLMASDRNGSSNYTYDSIYRMTEEAISRSEAKGTLTYGLDPLAPCGSCGRCHRVAPLADADLRTPVGRLAIPLQLAGTRLFQLSRNAVIRRYSAAGFRLS
jgi:hypothetical protein